MRGPITLWFGRSSGAWLAVLLLSATSTVRGERVIYVYAAAAGTNDGTSWGDAFADLQDALDDARTSGGCPCEIWVAAGTYKPDRGTGDQTLAFELANNIGVYGGFAGFEECREQRDRMVNETILSGDLAGDDDPQPVPATACCKTEIIGGTGYVECDDVECKAIVVAVDPGCATMWRPHCVQYAIELCCEKCRPTRCDNTYNVVRAIDTDSTPILDGLTIEGGEAISEQNSSGAGLDAWYSSLTVSRCAFRRNNAWDGAGVSIFSGEPTITESVFTENGGTFTWPFALSAQAWSPDLVTITNCTFRDNHGGGIWVLNGAKVENCRFLRNAGTGLLLSAWVSEDVIGCTFAGNTYSGLSAGGYVRVINCNFFGNFNPYSAGGMRGGYGGATLINCVFAGNRAGRDSYVGDGGAFLGSGFGVDRFINCTIVGNSATRWVGGISAHAVKNCILWGNTDDSGSTQHAQLAALRVDYSIVQGWDGSTPGTATTSIDPLLMDPIGPDGITGTEDDDLRLSPGSPAINAADPNATGLLTTDLDGHARVLCGRADIGAYEFGIGDFNCDQQVDLTDFAIWPACMTDPRPSAIRPGCEAFDFNADGDIDLSDVAAFERVFAAP